jgi:CDP-glycerol glycerophosphotransferase (TagB/SpsB family)
MVSLDSSTRGFFRKGSMPVDAKIVVSSKLEAKHFVDLGGFDYEDLYITGLPFYDRTIKNSTADKITIMPTWRPWDYNVLISNYEKSSYYKMVFDIFKNISPELRNKIILLPHPMVIDIFKTTPLGEYIPEIKSYDMIMEDTALLITDYSSIAYSAFYRGANVIFVWKEKEKCMHEYGGHLMLNENNVFGDVLYSYKDLNKAVKQNYLTSQNKEYLKKYKKIVEFHDNKNTERLIEKLEKTEFIRR